MTTNLSVSRLVDFSAIVTPAGVQALNTSSGLVLGTSAVIDTVMRKRNYQSDVQVAADFGTSAPEYLAAVAWFSQTPQPLSMSIGRWVNVASAGQLIGGPLSLANSVYTAWIGIMTGTLNVAVDGGGATGVVGLNFSGVTNLNGVAAVIQAAIRALGGSFAEVTFVYNAVYNNFVATSGGTPGTGSEVSFLTAEGTGVDVTGMLEMLSTSTGAYEAPGLAAESALACVALFDDRFGGQWYHCFGPSFADADAEAIAPYFDGDANPHFLWFNSQESGMLDPGDTRDIGYLLQQLMSQHAFVQYSSTSTVAAWSAAARIATVNWNGSNTAISLMYKLEPGVPPESLTDTQITNLESYNVNVFVSYETPTGVAQAILEPGICPSGQFADTIVGVDWLRSQCQANVLSILLQQSAKVPQTDPGVNTLLTGVTKACAQGVTNGLGAPGVWNAGGFGSLSEGQTMSKGYYVYAPPIATQSEEDRADRICPPIQVAFKLAGAIDLVSGTIYVNQ